MSLNLAFGVPDRFGAFSKTVLYREHLIFWTSREKFVIYMYRVCLLIRLSCFEMLCLALPCLALP